MTTRAGAARPLGVFTLVLFSGLWAGVPASAQAPTPLEQQCMTAVQGKVAWNRAGNTGWNDGNLRNLCRGTTDPGTTIACFRAQIQAHDNWSQAITACTSSPGAPAAARPPAPGPAAAAGAEKPVNHYTYLATHNAISSYAYGYNLQNSQRYDVTTQLNGGARMLEIDLVWDTPDDKEPAGVYICHCGGAPHSSSRSEAARAARPNIYGDPMKSKVPLPNWSHGTPRTRLSKILKEIDAWLVAHPAEIVFIMTENPNVLPPQFDREVAEAGLRTGTYVKPSNQTAWPTRSALLRDNQRLIILSGDSAKDAYGVPLLNGSRHVNVGHVVYAESNAHPSLAGGSNGYPATRGNDDKFLVLGRFRTTETDAVTAHLLNDPGELRKLKDQWVARGETRFPTFIQVNQVQTGDPLRFVNELNDANHQVTSTLKKDAAGEWIVSASASVATAVTTAVTAAATATREWIEGAPPAANARSITFNNQAGYVAKISVVYFVSEHVNGVSVPVAKVIASPDIALGFSRTLEIPADLAEGMPISVEIEGVGTVKGKVLSTTVPRDFSGRRCFKSWGTIFDAQGGAVPCS